MAGDPDKVYLIREITSMPDKGKRRNSENQKIKFGRKHFDALSDKLEDVVDFKDFVSLYDALSSSG